MLNGCRALYGVTDMAELHFSTDGLATGFPRAIGPSEAQLLKIPFTASASASKHFSRSPHGLPVDAPHGPSGRQPVCHSGALVVAYRPGILLPRGPPPCWGSPRR
jgi:hypothetical protein